MSAADTSAAADTRWWETRAALAAAMLFSVLPLVWPALPPLYDLPDHAGRYHVMADIARSADLQRHWTFEWALVPNLGVDLLVLALAPLFGIIGATKLAVAAIPPLFVLALFTLSRAATGRVSPAIGFALPLAYAAPFQMGFVNFCLSAALALLALAGWITMGRRERPWLRTLVFVPVVFVLWLAHSSGWGVFGVLAFAADWQRQRERGRGIAMGAVAAAIPLAPLAFPIALMIAGPGSEFGIGAEWAWVGKLLWLMSLLRDRWVWFDLVSTAAILMALYAGARSPTLRFDARLGMPALAMLAMFLALPWLMVGGAYVDMRLLYIAVALALIAIAPRPGPDPRTDAAPVLAVLGALFFAQRMLVATASMALAGQAQAAAERVLPALPRGAAVLVLVKEPCMVAWNSPRFGHLGGLAVIARDAFVNTQWTLAGQQLVRPRHQGAYASDPSQFIRPWDCPEHPPGLARALHGFDTSVFTHVWMLDFPANQRVTPSLREVARAPRSVLYRVEPSR